MIILHTFGPGLNMADPSPFVVKAMMLLKMAGLEYEEQAADVRKAPKQKLPVLVDDGETVPDSTFIRFHIEKKYGFDFDSALNEDQKAVAWAFEKMLEDHTYWCAVNDRWMDDANFAAGPAKFFDSLPALMRPLVKKMVRKQVGKSLYAHGMGRHSKAEIDDLGRRDIRVLAQLLGDKAFMMGDQPCGLDACAFPFLWGLLNRLFTSEARIEAEKHPNLVAYVERMHGQYFPGVGAV